MSLRKRGTTVEEEPRKAASVRRLTLEPAAQSQPRASQPSPARPPFKISSRVPASYLQYLREEHDKENRLNQRSSKIELGDVKARKRRRRLLYAVGRGNNGALVRRVMEAREKWAEAPRGRDGDFCNFFWVPVSAHLDFSMNEHFNIENTRGAPQKTVAANHLEFHQEVSSKYFLYKNMRQKYGKSIDDYMPPTFIFELDSDTLVDELRAFCAVFLGHAGRGSPAKQPPADAPPDAPADRFDFSLFAKHQRRARAKPRALLSRTADLDEPLDASLAFPRVFDGGKNLWLLKPDNCNRGKGVCLFSRLGELTRHLQSYLLGFDSAAIERLARQETDERRPAKLIKPKKFVLQKYIERLLLIRGRKFDIRIYGFVDQRGACWGSREGYIRTSSDEFSLDSQTPFVHLTNNAVQKYNESYCRFEEGNIAALRSLEALFGRPLLLKVREKIFEVMAKVLALAAERANRKRRKNCFEMFGFDFMVDEDEHVWLIEVNTNPCIEETNAFLRRLLPRVLNDMFALTIDQIFGDEDNGPRPVFPLEGFADDESIWTRLS